MQPKRQILYSKKYNLYIDMNCIIVYNDTHKRQRRHGCNSPWCLFILLDSGIKSPILDFLTADFKRTFDTRIL